VAGWLTPLVSIIVAVDAAAGVFSKFPLPSVNFFGTLWMSSLIVIVAIAVVLLGPGAISIDSRLFGRKKITIPSRH
jgi:uncharacterized membrane protein YphA (DoxX/SURF4 family)